MFEFYFLTVFFGVVPLGDGWPAVSGNTFVFVEN